MGNLAFNAINQFSKSELESMVNSIVNQSLRSPTHDNSQGFVFTVSGNSLKIDLDRQVPLHVFDPGGLTSQLGFGFLFEYLNQVATREQREFVITSSLSLGLFPVELELRQQSPSYESRKIFSQKTLDQRRCFRDRFDQSILSESQRKTVIVDMGKVNARTIFQGSPEFDQIVSAILESDRLLWMQRVAVEDTFRWIRWTKTEYHRKKDGFYFRELGAKIWDLPLLKLLTLFPSLSPLLYPLIRPITHHKLKAAVCSSAGFFVVEAKDFSPESRLILGQHGARAWLQATELGYACQPFSLQSWLACLMTGLKIPSGFSSDYQKLTEQVGTILNIHDRPFWLFRFGLLPKTAHPPSLRKPAKITFE